ncbi:hypothetical protein OAU99_01570 [Candidatus Poseidoniaceae archaeon]|nr:hypothetical protein [Candidatus Poseidoniaceae archaeon]
MTISKETKQDSQTQDEELVAQVTLLPDDNQVNVKVFDARNTVFEHFGKLHAPRVNKQAELIWSIGVDAVIHASQKGQLLMLEQKGSEVTQAISNTIENDLNSTLDKFFNQENGLMNANISEVLGENGTLQNMLTEHIVGKSSKLGETLSELIGPESNLAIALNPEHTNGLANDIQNKVDAALQETLDMTDDKSAISKLFSALRTANEEDSDNRDEQVSNIQNLLDPLNPKSPLKQLLDETSLSVENSAMSRIRAELKDSISSLETSMNEMKEFIIQKEAEETATNAVMDSSTLQGLRFEDQVGVFLDEISLESRLENTHTGNSVGNLTNCKKGDFVLKFEAGHQLSGNSIVVEVKSDNSYDTHKALEEMDKAIENRGSQAGLFIMNTSRARKTFPKMQRFGNIVLFQWDIEQDAALEKLNAALISTQLLAEKASLRSEGDRAKVADVADRIQSEVKRISKMDGWTNNIIRDADKMSDSLRVMKNKLRIAIDNTLETLRSLGIDEVKITDDEDWL